MGSEFLGERGKPPSPELLFTSTTRLPQELLMTEETQQGTQRSAKWKEMSKPASCRSGQRGEGLCFVYLRGVFPAASRGQARNCFQTQLPLHGGLGLCPAPSGCSRGTHSRLSQGG